MPNHITNIIINDEELNYEKYISTDPVKGEYFDFNKVIQMPPELEYITCPINLVSEEEKAEQLVKLQAWKDKGEGWNKPVLGITLEEQKTLIENFGYDNWYDWSIANWGTKWNSYSCVVEQEGGILSNEEFLPQIKLKSFDTAWSIPSPVFEKLAELEQKQIEMMSKDEGDCVITLSTFYQDGTSSIIDIAELEYDEDQDCVLVSWIDSDYDYLESTIKANF